MPGLAKWHVLRVQQGWSPDPQEDTRQALECTRRAFDNDATCSLALAIDGFVHTNLLKQFDVAESRYELALSVNPNDSLAWLLLGTLFAFKGQGKEAVRNTSSSDQAVAARSAALLLRLTGSHCGTVSGPVRARMRTCDAFFAAESCAHLDIACAGHAQWQLGHAEEARTYGPRTAAARSGIHGQPLSHVVTKRGFRDGKDLVGGFRGGRRS